MHIVKHSEKLIFFHNLSPIILLHLINYIYIYFY